jgi:hypothetical protein
MIFKRIFWKGRVIAVHLQSKSRSRAAVARRAHNPKVGGSIPPFATKASKETCWFFIVALYSFILCDRMFALEFDYLPDLL